jgi:hypothetical protein
MTHAEIATLDGFGRVLSWIILTFVSGGSDTKLCAISFHHRTRLFGSIVKLEVEDDMEPEF